jgi:colicin import membrane protein
MAGQTRSPTISLRERSFPVSGGEERLAKWLTFSLLLHAGVIASFFLLPFLPSRHVPEPPIYTVDLVGGEKLGGASLGTALTPAPREASKKMLEPAAPVIEPKQEKKQEKAEKTKKIEKAAPTQEEVALKKDNRKKEPSSREIAKAAKTETKSDEGALEQVRERLIQSAVERAKNRTESGQKSSKAEVISSGPGEGEGSAALGAGGRGGPGVVKGIDFIVYQNRLLSTIKDNWAWVGQRGNLKVVVHFGVKDNGDIVGLKVVQPSGDPSYDESVLRAVKKSSPLPAPPESYRKDFADVELTFRPRDLGA